MIMISNNELNSGINLSRRVYDCKNSHNCLWLKRTNLFSGYLPRACPKEDCPVVIFRKKFEGDSPCYYAEALRLSQWWCVSSAGTIDKRREVDRKMLERRIGDLDIYGQLVTLVIHPLNLATRRIPLLKPKEIETLKGSWCFLKEKGRTVQAMREINPAWVSRLEFHLENILSNQYRDAIFYLAYLFLKGLEKNQLPDFGAMPQEETKKVFSEIEKYLSV